MDRRNEIVLSKDGGEGRGGGCLRNISKGCDGFIDRSKVRILLCDNDSKSSDEVFKLLCGCSYQVTPVRSPRQVIDALNAEGPDIDIILSEVDLPMAKGLKMLKYIMRDKGLRRIPVIMMSAQDEVSVVVKCLRLGAADYLVKPLRTNELLNLWTHMWRRRRMLGLEEKNILSYDFDLVASEPSDANTNSTTLFSDDTDDKSRKSANPETCVSAPQRDEMDAAITAAPTALATVDLPKYWPDVLATSQWRRGQISSFPKKSELKIGESSAFFTYVKSSMLKIDTEGVIPVNVNTRQHLRIEKKLSLRGGQENINTQGNASKEVQENHEKRNDFPSSKSVPDSIYVERSCTPPPSQLAEFSQQRNSKMEEFCQIYTQPRNDNTNHNVSSFNAHAPYPYYISGVMNQQYMMSSQQNHHIPSIVLPQYNHIPHYPHMAPFPYYPWPPGQMPAEQQPYPPPPPHGSSSSNTGNLNKVDRREAALIKFRQKRKERCFDKKIRYVKRKRLAEKRPRVRGQFVRKNNGLHVDLNGQPVSADYDDDDEDDDDESPEDDASVFR
ncbi:hypothetical protein LguiB_022893 [Lonicera macranthoides]